MLCRQWVCIYHIKGFINDHVHKEQRWGKFMFTKQSLPCSQCKSTFIYFIQISTTRLSPTTVILKILFGKCCVKVNTDWCRKANPGRAMLIPAYLRDILKMAVPVRRGLQECTKCLWHSFSQLRWLPQCWGVLGLLNARILRTTLYR
jgi:hypothetical protein